MSPDDAFLEQLIGNQRRAIRYYFIFAVALVALGIGVMVFGYWSSAWLQTEALRSVFQVAGVFVSALCALPVKEILNRKERVGIFETIKARLHTPSQTQDAPAEGERKRLNDLLWQVVEKTALG